MEKGDLSLASTSTTQKQTIALIKEIWSHVITTTCPHCKHKSPSVKRDGYTKLFLKPLQAKVVQANQQAKALKQKQSMS